jgi:hypothetical protein|eukprot:83396_1
MFKKGFLISSSMSITQHLTASAFALRIQGSSIPSVNKDYEWKSANIVPKGFAQVCQQNQWDVESTWNRLNGGRDWFHAPSNDAYVYLNSMDNHWWIDEPNGRGVFIAFEKKPLATLKGKTLPPTDGWKVLGGGNELLPSITIVE